MLNELEAFSKIDSPNIVTLMGAFFDSESMAFVLEYMNRGASRGALSVLRLSGFPYPVSLC